MLIVSAELRLLRRKERRSSWIRFSGSLLSRFVSEETILVRIWHWWHQHIVYFHLYLLYNILKIVSTDPASFFNIANVDNFVQCQGLNPILQYANSFAVPQVIANAQQGNAPAVATTVATTNHFVPHVNSGSVTSTPITGSNPHTSIHIPQQQPAKPFLHPGNVAAVEATPQPSGLPVPQLMMSMITPVHNQLESTLGGYDACFTG